MSRKWNHPCNPLYHREESFHSARTWYVQHSLPANKSLRSETCCTRIGKNFRNLHRIRLEAAEGTAPNKLCCEQTVFPPPRTIIEQSLLQKKKFILEVSDFTGYLFRDYFVIVVPRKIMMMKQIVFFIHHRPQIFGNNEIVGIEQVFKFVFQQYPDGCQWRNPPVEWIGSFQSEVSA